MPFLFSLSCPHPPTKWQWLSFSCPKPKGGHIANHRYWVPALCQHPSEFRNRWDGNGKVVNGTPLQSSCLENPMGGRAWWAAVHGVVKSQTRLSGFTFTFHFHALEKKMAAHSSFLAWRIPGTGEPGGLPSMGLQSQTQLKRLSSSSSSETYENFKNIYETKILSCLFHR